MYVLPAGTDLKHFIAFFLSGMKNGIVKHRVVALAAHTEAQLVEGALVLPFHGRGGRLKGPSCHDAGVGGMFFVEGGFLDLVFLQRLHDDEEGIVAELGVVGQGHRGLVAGYLKGEAPLFLVFHAIVHHEVFYPAA